MLTSLEELSFCPGTKRVLYGGGVRTSSQLSALRSFRFLAFSGYSDLVGGMNAPSLLTAEANEKEPSSKGS
jgi:hypothetical protein